MLGNIEKMLEEFNLLSNAEFFDSPDKLDCEICLADDLSRLCSDTTCLAHNDCIMWSAA